MYKQITSWSFVLFFCLTISGMEEQKQISVTLNTDAIYCCVRFMDMQSIGRWQQVSKYYCQAIDFEKIANHPLTKDQYHICNWKN